MRIIRPVIKSIFSNSTQALINAILSTTTPFVVPQDLARVKEMLVELANYARSLDRQLSLIRGTAIQPETLPSSTSSTLPDRPAEHEEGQDVEVSVESLSQDLGQFSIDYAWRHFGKSGYLTSIQSSIDSRQDVGGRSFYSDVFRKLQRPEFWAPRIVSSLLESVS